MVARVSTFLALLSAAATTLAAPSPSFYHISTHGKRAIATSGQIVESFHPLATYQTYGDGIEVPHIGKVRRDDPASLVSAASSFLSTQFGFDASNFQAGNTAVGDVATHVWFKQLINGKPVVNAVANIALNKDNKVVASGVNFIKPAKVSATDAKISTDDALAAAEKQLSGTRVADVPVTTEYFLNEANEAVLVHVTQVQTADGNHWYQAYVDATTGTVVGSVDFVSQAAFHVLPINKQDPTEGLQTLQDPEDKISSPNGWTTVGGKDTQATAGNNAIAFKGAQSATAAASAQDTFVFDFDDTKDPTGAANLNSAKTNAFFIVNTIHDITYRYGFDEGHFNFQQDNNGKGGKGNDRVLISVQDASGKNNANFATPPDGQSGTMRMFIWDLIKPTNRDGDLENDIVSHEMTHGISNRLTGGGTGTCLSTTEAGGMGEGWSDTMAFWLEQKDGTVKDFSMGTYVAGKGIRSHPYSTDPKVNPLTFADVAKLNEVHNIGEVWANILVNVYAGLVADLGFSKDAFTNPDGKEGNVVFMHLFLDSLALQPCNPTMVSARDAWIQADANRYKGANTCTIWKAFASRGLGQKAPTTHVNDSTIPDECKGGSGNPTTTVAPPTSTGKPTSTVKPTSTAQPTSTTKPSSTSQPQPTSTVGVGKVNIVARFPDGSTSGGLLTRGTLSTNTLATFQAAGADGGGFTIKTSRGSCGVASDATLSCGNGDSSVFHALKDGNDLILAFNDASTWSASGLPNRSAPLTVSAGDLDTQSFQLLITQA